MEGKEKIKNLEDPVLVSGYLYESHWKLPGNRGK